MKKYIMVIIALFSSILFADMLFAAANTWTQKTDFGGTIRQSAVSFSIGNKGYIGTGYNKYTSSYYKDFWEYDPSTNAWTQKADFGGTARASAVGLSIGSKGYIGPGWEGGTSVKKDFWEYDPSTNAWTQKADFGGTARASAAGFSIGSKGYIGLGTDGSYTTDFWEYDPAADTWTQKANFGGAGREGTVGFSIGTKGYIGTGEDDNSSISYKDFWQYDPAANAWTRKADFGGIARGYAVGFGVGSKGYIGTGTAGSSTYQDFWEYDPDANTWTRKADLGGSPRNAAVGFSIGSKGYIGTGSNNAAEHKDFWEYDPYTWIYSNSIDANNSVKVTDLSGSLPFAGATITVSAWDASGNALTESSSPTALKLYSNGTTTISGSSLAARFTGIPVLYALSADSAKYIVSNVKMSTDGTLNIPNGYASDTTKFVTNSVGARNSIKITDMSGAIDAPGAAITVKAWDVNGVPLTESSGAIPLRLFSHGTTTILGPDLQARFPSATPMTYEFTVGSSKYVIVNVKSSSDGSVNIPYAFTSGSTKFVANSIGYRNNISISDLSGTLPAAGAAITVAAWDVDGIPLTQSGSATSLTLQNYGTTTIPGLDLQNRFPAAIPMAYEFTVNSAKYIITNTKRSTDGTITIPFVYISGMNKYAINSVSNRNTIKITDTSGSLPSTGAAITVAAGDANGNSLAEVGGVASLKLFSNGTTTINGLDLIARFQGTPVLYKFTIGSTQYVITNLVANTDNTINVPSVYSNGVAGGI